MENVKENVRQEYNRQLIQFALFNIEDIRRCVNCLGKIYGLSEKDIEEDIEKARKLVDEKWGGD